MLIAAVVMLNLTVGVRLCGCAYCRYTYGQPVNGHADVYVELLQHWRTRERVPRKHYRVTVHIIQLLLELCLLLQLRMWFWHWRVN